MYKPTNAEKNHAKKMREHFTKAIAASALKARTEQKLIGCDEIRSVIAWKAALKATGYEVPGIIFRDIPVTLEMQKIAERVFDEATEAATSVLLTLPSPSPSPTTSAPTPSSTPPPTPPID